MLNVHDLSITIGARDLLREVSFVLNPGDRAGLVGPNGCGKSTLLRVLAGLESPTKGSVSIQKNAAVAYLPQEWTGIEQMSIGDVLRDGVPGLRDTHAQLRDLEGRLASAEPTEIGALTEEYGDALTRFEQIGGYALEAKAQEMLSGLGLSSVSLDVPLDRLSGGQRTRVGLARILFNEPDLALLDEPTNHLDIGSLEWLESFLRAHRGALLVVSHDRVFLDRTVNRILVIDEETGRVASYPGTYSDYEASVEAALERRVAAFRDQQAEITRLRKDAIAKKQRAQATESKTTHDFYRGRAKKVAKRAKAVERRLERYLEREDLLERPARPWRLNPGFADMPRAGDVVLSLSEVAHRYTRSWLFRARRLELHQGERVAVIGPNGCGKSTLLRIIAGEIAPTEGTVRLGASVYTGHLRQEGMPEAPDATPVEVIRRVSRVSETDARNFLHHFLFAGDDAITQTQHLSAGERVRLSLAALVMSGSNFLILDEPMNHLDISSREQLEMALDAFPGTMLVVAHDRAFIDRFASKLWVFESREEGFEIEPFLDREEMTGIHR